MDRHHEALQTEEFYSQGIDMIKASIVGIQREITPIKTFLRNRRKEIVRDISSGTKQVDRSCTYDFAQMFYEYALKEIAKVEEVCERCLVQLNVDILAASRDRMQPPSYLFPEELRKAQAICCDMVDETVDNTPCHCTWENISMWKLDDTQDIIAKPRKEIRTEFDESDLKFKQEIIYLRSKMFSLPRRCSNVKAGNNNSGPKNGQRQSNVLLSMETPDFLQALTRNEYSTPFTVKDELRKIQPLKFLDGKFSVCEYWTKVLDVHGHQYWSKWHLVLCPQIEKIAKKRSIPMIRLSPVATFNFLATIKAFSNFELDRSDLASLLKHKKDAVWLNSWKMQFNETGGVHVAATVIQSSWRGYWLRRKRWLSSRLYVAASIIWFAWLTSKQKMEMHRCYLKNMLISLQTTRELTSKLSNEFYSIIQEPHVVIHLPSLGHPMELRRILNPKIYSIFQNVTILRICFVRNPKTEVIYILPVKPSRDLLMMYSDFIESMAPGEDFAKRITFIALSQIETFKNRPLNVSRILHCSEDTLRAIQEKINDKSAYFLPSVIDECDMRVAGRLNIPLLSPDMEQQRRFLNLSQMSELLDSIGVLQPPHARNIMDYDTLCESLAQLMVLHTEVCMWIIKLNYGMVTKHSGIFLINHISVPFMPILRREREKYGDDWKIQSSLREEFLEKVRAHLPKVIPSVIQLPSIYSSWQQFYIHIMKLGCLLQAVPFEKKSRTIVVSLFVPGKTTKRKPRWLGTSDKLHLESTMATHIFMLPQSSLDIAKIEPTVNKVASSMQNRGFMGYMSVDCYCYVQHPEEKLIVLVLNVFPYYTFSHSFIDCIKFATDGVYNNQNDTFTASLKSGSVNTRKRSSVPFGDVKPAWDETAERYTVAITQLHHSRFAVYRWPGIKRILEECGIVFNRKTKEGSSILLHDGEVRTVGLMIGITANMQTTLSMIHDQLNKLYKALTVKKKKNIESNVPDLIDFFLKLSLDYTDLAADVCLQNF